MTLDDLIEDLQRVRADRPEGGLLPVDLRMTGVFCGETITVEGDADELVTDGDRVIVSCLNAGVDAAEDEA